MPAGANCFMGVGCYVGVRQMFWSPTQACTPLGMSYRTAGFLILTASISCDGDCALRPHAHGTFSVQQRGVQKLHHVLDLRVQLQHVALGNDVGQDRQEVISAVHPPCGEAGIFSPSFLSFMSYSLLLFFTQPRATIYKQRKPVDAARVPPSSSAHRTEFSWQMTLPCPASAYAIK